MGTFGRVGLMPSLAAEMRTNPRQPPICNFFPTYAAPPPSKRQEQEKLHAIFPTYAAPPPWKQQEQKKLHAMENLVWTSRVLGSPHWQLLSYISGTATVETTTEQKLQAISPAYAAPPPSKQQEQKKLRALTNLVLTSRALRSLTKSQSESMY